MRVFLTHNPEDLEAYFGRALPDLRSVAEVVLNHSSGDLNTDELIAAAAGCDVIVAHRSAAAEAALFEQRPELLAFLRCAVDISTIDVDAASEFGVLVGRADKSFIASTAELALGLLLDVSRKISDSTIDYRRSPVASEGGPSQRAGRQLRGQTAGIIGYGSVGSYLAELLLALGLEVVVHDPFVDVVPDPIERLNLAELLSVSDVVFPLAPAMPATENLIGPEELQAMRPGAVLINVSRGELLDEAAVAAALADGRLGGLGMDVGRAPDQRPSPDLASLPGVVSTPHLGGLTPENADAQAASSVEQVQAIIRGDMPPRTVNPASIDRLRNWWHTKGLQ